MSVLAGLNLEAWGPSALIVVAVLMIYFGLLVPRSIHLRALRDRDQRIEVLQKLTTEQATQIRILLEGNKTTIRVVESIPLSSNKEET